MERRLPSLHKSYGAQASQPAIKPDSVYFGVRVFGSLPRLLQFSARRAVIVSKPQASAWGKNQEPSSLGEAIRDSAIEILNSKFKIQNY